MVLFLNHCIFSPQGMNGQIRFSIRAQDVNPNDTLQYFYVDLTSGEIFIIKSLTQSALRPSQYVVSDYLYTSSLPHIITQTYLNKYLSRKHKT